MGIDVTHMLTRNLHHTERDPAGNPADTVREEWRIGSGRESGKCELAAVAPEVVTPW
jgi:hypothetical protein